MCVIHVCDVTSACVWCVLAVGCAGLVCALHHRVVEHAERGWTPSPAWHRWSLINAQGTCVCRGHHGHVSHARIEDDSSMTQTRGWGQEQVSPCSPSEGTAMGGVPDEAPEGPDFLFLLLLSLLPFKLAKKKNRFARLPPAKPHSPRHKHEPEADPAEGSRRPVNRHVGGNCHMES